MSLLKKRIQAKKMGEQRKVAPAKPLTDKPRIVAGLGIVLDTTKSEEFTAEIDRRISFKSRFAKETKDRQQKLAEMRGEVATAQKEKAAKPAVSISDSESRLRSRADKGNSSHFPIPSEPARARMCAKGDKVQGIENGETLVGRVIIDDNSYTIKAKKEGDKFYAYKDDARQNKWAKVSGLAGQPTMKLLNQALSGFYKDIEFAENGRFKSFAAADKGYLIKGPKDGDEQLYWSNDMGWVDKNSATRFSKEDVQGYLPKGATGTERISKATAAADPVADLPKDVPAAELEEGASVEKEHGATYENIKAYYAEHGEFPPFDTVTEWIATDHLKEFANYYEALEAMEKELKAGQKPEAEAMRASAAKTVTFQTKNGKEGTVVVSKATNFDYRISKKEAERLLKEFGYDLPFDIMCKEYGQDEDWVGVVEEDLNEDGTLDDDYKTFELSGGNLPPAKAMKADAASGNTEKAINKAVNEYWEPKLGERGNRLINWLNADLYHGPYAAGTTDEEDNPNATYPGFTSAIDELREIIDNAGGFQDMYYDNDTGGLSDKEPEAFEDEETGEMIEPYIEETYHLEGRDVARYVLGKELVSYVI